MNPQCLPPTAAACAPAERAEHEKWMRRCLQLARAGELAAAPNPMVGAVVVHEGRILGEGYHVRCGTPHAEVNALRAVRPASRALLGEATIYVSLEPCAHYGRTPPCAELIVSTGLKRCVVGCVDPFARVSGRGIDIMRSAGVEVLTGVLEAECLALNRKFVTAQTQRRPFITLKWAASADGYIDAWREPGCERRPVRLSSPLSLTGMHHLRAQHAAILVGHATLLADRPTLTVRHWADAGAQPLRVCLGRVAEGELPAGFTAFADLPTLLADLYARGAQSLLVEGGSQTLQSFIDAGLWDEAREELSPLCLGSGVPAPKMPVGCERRIERRWGRCFTWWRK